MAGDPTSGRVEARAVVDTIVGEGDKELVDVTVATAAAGAATIVATGGHPFWVDDEGAWIEARDLEGGDQLLTPEGERVTVTGLRLYRETKKVHNLTVDGIHTYYVQAGDGTSALVHDCAASGGSATGATPELGAGPRPLGELPPAGPPDGPTFIAHSNGEVVVVPSGATGPTPATGGKGFQFTGGSGGPGLDPRVTDVRVMDPVTGGKYPYPKGYASYSNGAGQTVNPVTGQTVSKADPWWHWPWS